VQKREGRVGQPQIELDRPDQQREDLPVDEGKDIGKGADRHDIPPLAGVGLARDGLVHERFLTGR
jgi:hypothetical protein